MYIQQLYTNCLAEAAYYIESNGEAAIIDPLREIEPYLELLEQRGAKLRYIFETHFHADFVSGHIDLARKTGAQIVYGPGAQAQYEIVAAADGQEFEIGFARMRVIHTPGHTTESSCFLLVDPQGNEHAIFTGDTLFIGDVGRPDLAVRSNLTKEQLGEMLYDSIHAKLLPLSDEIIVYPGHGAGSACGKSMSKETFDTLGNQKKVNYALQPMTKAEFVATVLEGQVTPPAYFPENAKINKGGYDPIDEVIERNLVPLAPDRVAELMAEGVLVLDTRSTEDFVQGHIPGSVSIGVDGQFAPWVGAVLQFNRPLVLVCDTGREAEAVIRLARIGFEQVHGFLDGGMAAWAASGRAVHQLRTIASGDVARELAQGAQVVDVRRPAEYAAGHLAGAPNLPLDDYRQWIGTLDPNKPYLVHCAGGYRSVIMGSLMKAAGFSNVTNVAGGFGALKEQPTLTIEASSPVVA